MRLNCRSAISEFSHLVYEASGNNSYLYDLNGNEVKNLSQNMSYAHYNNLNLPNSVVFLFGSSLTMHYSADGRRMRTQSRTYSTPISVPSDDGEYIGTPFSVFDEMKEGALTLQDGIPVRYDFDGGYYSLQNDSTGLAELTPYLYETELQGSVRYKSLINSIIQ